MQTRSRFLIAGIAMCATPLAAPGQSAESASSSIMAHALQQSIESPLPPSVEGDPPVTALMQFSMFAVAPPEERIFRPHDLIQIIVRETSESRSIQELDLEKEWDMEGAIEDWPAFMLPNLLEMQLRPSDSDNLPVELGIGFAKDFEGDGEYQRGDDFTARLSAEVLEVLPNGNLILESRTKITTDEETATITVTGICRPDDVTAANTILSNQIHDLSVTKINTGELKKTNEKGIISKVMEAIFAF